MYREINLLRGVVPFAVSVMAVGAIALPVLAQDECTSAVVVQTAVPVAYSTVNATLSAGRPTDELCPGTSLSWLNSKDVWFKYIAPENGIARFSTCDIASYDTSMAMYTGSCDSLILIACNGDMNDSTGCQENSAAINNFVVTAGTTYYIRIGGFEGASGSGTFNVTYSRVAAWGSNASGQCRVPQTLGMVTKLAAGGDHVVALNADNQVRAWGANQFTQATVPATVGSAIEVAAGSAHSLAIRTNGSVAAWGRNSSGQCNVPATLTDAISIAGGANHSMAARATGAVLAWGSNLFQQCTIPVGLTGAVQVAAGDIHSMARRSDGSVASWGSNNNGQSTVPVSLGSAIDIAAGSIHSLAVRTNGTVFAWGSNDFGQTSVPSTLANVTDVSAGRFHSLALRSDGVVVAWGYDANNQVTVPAQMGTFSQVVAGGFFSLGLRDACPTDPNKVEVGPCGCGVVDSDSDVDGDAVLDCNDLCPSDPNKTAPGQCGCGSPDIDSDSDGVADCVDQCPSDPSKSAPGQCGCGFADTDTDGDSTPDCVDLCPNLAALTAPATYYADADLDGFGALLNTIDVCAITAPAGFVVNSLDCNDGAVIYADVDLDTFGSTTMVACNGVASSTDCDDSSNAVYPGALENCANLAIDNNCDQIVTDAEAIDSVDYFVDGDSDLFGAGLATKSCVAIVGSVINSTDCDDADASINPSAIEDCANLAVDNNCDLIVTDAEAIDSIAYFVDSDNDGFGAGLATKSCSPIAGSVINSSDCDDASVIFADVDLDTFGSTTMVACNGVASSNDCDDSSSAVYPGALENCANIAVDNNCDLIVTDTEAVDSISYFVDGDSDLFGAGLATKSCSPIVGSVANSTDCDDAAASINPSAIEDCSNLAIDNNCNLIATDEEAVDSISYCNDTDNDGFGAGAITRSCTLPAGMVANGTDCNDESSAIFPTAIETCANDGVDNNCNGINTAAEAIDSTGYYPDLDGDGFGAGAVTMSCTAVAGSVSNATDCNDSAVLYTDADGDGFGTGSPIACDGAIAVGDCNDASSAVNPNAIELCADLAVDNNCNGSTDETEATDRVTFYADTDSDTFGDSAVTALNCVAPAGFVIDNTDGCPNNAQLQAARTYCADTDSDTFGNAASTTSVCEISAPAGFVVDSTDCDDASSAVYPNAIELCADLAVDNNCNGSTDETEATDRVTFFADTDSDTFGDSAVTSLNCVAPAGFVIDSTDCNDASSAVYPNAIELCADLAVDNNCDGSTAETEATDRVTFYADTDSDTFGDSAVSALNCVAPAGFVVDSTDCNDASSAVYPNAIELCADLAVDNNCNGSTAESEATDRVIFFADSDNDGAGDAAITSLNCVAPAGFVAIAGDNCPSNGALTAPITYYRDTDNDGAGDASDSAQFCNSTAPAGYSANSNDGCPVDANKTTAGTCGCGVADTDTDSDGTPDCTDGCPTNPNKTAPGTCGCGVADTDTDGDGRADCVDNCPAISNADQRDCNANSIGDVCEIAAGTGADCNTNGLLDSCDIGTGISTDLDSSGSPDECELVVGGTGFATIQDALDQAENGTTIMVGPGTYPPFVVFKRGLTVQSIAGERLTYIDGGNNARCIEITGRAGARFTVRGFTVQRGWADEGAGMLINDADPMIDHCIFTNNIATGTGGAIRAINGSADITVTSFLFNSAGSGGAISTSNPAASTAILYVSNSILRQNSAATDGGAIVSAGHMQLLECTIEQNVAGGLGGGVKQTAIGDLTVFTSRFCRNLPDNINGAFTGVGDNVFSQDCNANGLCDIDEILSGAVGDCNANGLPDACEISSGAAGDCNANSIPDSCDITQGTSADIDTNGIPDECKPDCNNNGIPDSYEIATGAAFDCNTNGVLDSCEIAAGTATDCNTNGVLDSCEIADGTANDCNSNGVIDTCDVAAGAADADQDGRLDGCEFARGDLNLDGIVNAVDLAMVLTNWGPATTGDTNADGIVNAFDLSAVLAGWGVIH